MVSIYDDGRDNAGEPRYEQLPPLDVISQKLDADGRLILSDLGRLQLRSAVNKLLHWPYPTIRELILAYRLAERREYGDIDSYVGTLLNEEGDDMKAATQLVEPQRGNPLLRVQKGKRPAPDRVLIIGTEGVGKSTFAADAPSPIFISTEDGLRHLDVASFPEIETLEDVYEDLRSLENESHTYRTVCIDTLDGLEGIVWQHVCRKEGWKNIEAPGYGKGYVVALDEWRKIIAALDRLRTKKGMEIIAIAHAAIKQFANPSGADYARYEPKLHRQAAALWREWSESVLFATFEEYVRKATGERKEKATSTGRRVIFTQHSATHDGKNRYGLPEELDLSYEEYAAARLVGQSASLDAIRNEATKLLDELHPDDTLREKVTAAMTAAEEDAIKWSKILNRLRNLVAEKEST